MSLSDQSCLFYIIADRSLGWLTGSQFELIVERAGGRLENSHKSLILFF